MRQTRRIDAIDGLRGVAILMVIYQHVYSVALRSAVTKTIGGYPWVIGHAWMGVSIFFVLSGFVLTLPFVSDSLRLKTWSDCRRFYIHRTMRLGPLFVVMALLSFGIAMHDGPAPFRSLILTLSTCSMFTTSEFFPTINGPFWSLAIEIWFSILFPAVLLAAVRFGFAKTLIAVGLLSLVVRIAGVGFPFTNVNVNPVKDSVLGRLDDFVVGMALAQLYAKGVLPRFTGRHALAGAAIIAMAAGLWDMSASLPGAAVALSNNVLQVGLALVLIAALNESNRVASILSAWPLRVAGAMCFSLYCWHSLLIGPELRGAPFDLINQALYWGTLILLAATTYRFIEFPRSNAADIFSLPTPPRPPVPVEKD